MLKTLFGILALMVASLSLACSAPRAQIMESPIVQEMTVGQEKGTETFDHQQLNELLAAHVREDGGRIDYQGLASQSEQLDAYLRRVAEASMEDLPADEQHALLINAYNAYTLRLILDHYPNIASIRDISNPWGQERFVVAGHTLSLDNIEHNLIRPVFKDPRIHFAVNCAAKGCPPLRAFAFTGAGLDEQLEQATRELLNNRAFVRVENNRLRVTKIMEWYEEDFVDESFHGASSSIPGFIHGYADGEVKALIDERGDETPISFLDYDWSLNDIDR